MSGRDARPRRNVRRSDMGHPQHIKQVIGQTQGDVAAILATANARQGRGLCLREEASHTPRGRAKHRFGQRLELFRKSVEFGCVLDGSWRRRLARLFQGFQFGG